MKYLYTLLAFMIMSINAFAQDGNGSFSFTNEATTYQQDFNEYLGTLETLPAFFSVTWDEGRVENPFTGIGDFETSNPDEAYGGFSAFSATEDSYSFGIRERAPIDLRDARLFFTFTNNTDQPISQFEVSYDVEAWFIGDRRNRIRLKFDTMVESEDRDTFEEDLFSTDNPSAATEAGSKVNGSLTENRTTVSGLVDITTVDQGDGTFFEPLAPGETAYFRWQFSNADGDGGSLRSGLAINNLTISAVIETDEPGDSFSFTNEAKTYTQNFNNYRGSFATLPTFFSLTWDNDRTDNPFTGVGDFETSDSDEAYGGFTAYTAGDGDYSFGIREREPVDLRDARLFFTFTNNTDEPISTFDVSYDVEAWFIGDRRNRLRLKFDTIIESEDRDTFDEDVFSTDNPSAETEVGAKVNGSLAENRTTVSSLVDITTLDRGDGVFFEPLAPGETAYFRWQFSNADGDGGSLRSGLAINNLVISISNVTSTERGADVPGKVALDQNYPNPFNPATTISFTLPQTEYVQLSVYNIQGQLVATLVNEQRSSGSHHVTFNAENLSSGLYLYRLQAGSQSITKKMMLVK